jgi:hypothetical protein
VAILQGVESRLNLSQASDRIAAEHGDVCLGEASESSVLACSAALRKGKQLRRVVLRLGCISGRELRTAIKFCQGQRRA